MKKILWIIVLASMATRSYAMLPPEKELKESQVKIAHLQTQIKKDISTQTQLHDYLVQLDQQIALLNQQSVVLTTQLHHDQIHLAALQKDRAMQETQLNQERHLLALQLEALYRLSTTNTLKIIFTPNNLTAIDRHLYYAHYLNVTRAKALRRIDLAIQHLNENLVSLQEEQQQLNSVIERKQAQEKILQSAELTRQQLLNKLTDSIQQQQVELSQLITHQHLLEETIANLHQHPELAMGGQLSFTQSQGKLKWPVLGNTSPTYGHYFVLIKNPSESRVKAIFTGKVIFANWLRGFGLLVIINHGSGYMSLYGRNEALYAKVGDYVAAGDVIASLQQTNKTDHSTILPNLYFEIRHDGHALDPHVWCS